MWCFWFKLLVLIISNDVGFFLLKVGMARGRRLRRNGGGLLEIDKKNVIALDQRVEQNVVASDQTISKQNLTASDQVISKQNVVASD